MSKISPTCKYFSDSFIVMVTRESFIHELMTGAISYNNRVAFRYIRFLTFKCFSVIDIAKCLSPRFVRSSISSLASSKDNIVSSTTAIKRLECRNNEREFITSSKATPLNEGNASWRLGFSSRSLQGNRNQFCNWMNLIIRFFTAVFNLLPKNQNKINHNIQL